MLSLSVLQQRQSEAAKYASRKVIKQKKITPGEQLVEHMRGKATVKISADEILSITRGKS